MPNCWPTPPSGPPEQENGLYQVSLDQLLAEPKVDRPGDSLQGHPLERMVAVLKDLETWHAAASRPQAALEARLERLRRLHAAFTEQEDRTKIRTSLANHLPTYRRYPWWSMGQSTLVEMVKQEPVPGKMIRALALARAGHDAFPESIGGQRCLFEVKAIQDSEFNFTAMQSDGPRKRSIEVSHRNLPVLHFRAYLVDLKTPGRYRGNPSGLTLAPQEQEPLLSSAKPAAQWTVNLAPTPDFETHKTFVTPPMAEPGYYVLFASELPDFRQRGNRVEVTDFIVTDLVLLVRRNWTDRLIEVQVLSGSTGQPVEGAQVEVFAHDWNSGHRLVQTLQTSLNGTVSLQNLRAGSYFLIARHGRHLAIEQRGLYANDYSDPGRSHRLPRLHRPCNLSSEPEDPVEDHCLRRTL